MFVFIAAAAFACRKDNTNPEPVIPTENTLEVDKTILSLRYLERDTINVPGVNAEQVKWNVATGGDEIVTLLGNVVVGRRKGKAVVVAEYGGKAAAINVEVTTEEYIPVRKIIWEINGQRVESVDDAVYDSFVQFVYYDKNVHGGFLAPEDAPKVCMQDEIEIKVVGYEPANASWPVVTCVKAGLFFSFNASESSAFNSEGKIEGQTGKMSELPTILLNDYNVDDREPESLIYYIYPFPNDLKLTQHDNEQLENAYRVPGTKDRYKRANKALFFYVNQPSMEVMPADKNYWHKDGSGICIRSGESIVLEDALTVVPLVPKKMPKTYDFILANDNRHWGRLHISDGILSLDGEFSDSVIENAVRSGKISLMNYDIRYDSWKEDGLEEGFAMLRAKDTVIIGSLGIGLLRKTSKYYDEVVRNYGEDMAEMMLHRGQNFDIYWVRK